MLLRVIARAPGYLLLAAVLAINAGCAAKKCDLTNPRKTTFKLKIQTQTNQGKVEPTGVNHGDGSSANLLKTCPGDTVKWELKDYDFVIAFDKGTSSAFSWTTKNAANDGANNWSADGSVEDKEPKNVDLKYSIQIVDGGKLDPIIIVER
jgi:hypothetical protein